MAGRPVRPGLDAAAAGQEVPDPHRHHRLCSGRRAARRQPASASSPFRDTKSGRRGRPPRRTPPVPCSPRSARRIPSGVAAQLDPAEAALFSDMSGDILTELKRLRSSTRCHQGGPLRHHHQHREPHLRSGPPSRSTTTSIVKLTGGTITVTIDPSKLQLTDKVKGAFGDKIARCSRRPRPSTSRRRSPRTGQGVPDRHRQAGRHLVPERVLHPRRQLHARKAGNPSAADVIPAAAGTPPKTR